MKKINAAEFFWVWQKKVTARKQEMLSVWRNNKALTSFVKGSENSIIDQIADHFGLLSYPQDYYSIDAILYQKEDLTPENKRKHFLVSGYTGSF